MIQNRSPLERLSVNLHRLDEDRPEVGVFRSKLVAFLRSEPTDLDPVFRFADAFAGLIEHSADPIPLEDLWSVSVSRLVDTGALLDPVASIDSLDGSEAGPHPLEEALRAWASELIEDREDRLDVEAL